MISTDILKRINTDNFKDNDLIEFCSCGWQTIDERRKVEGTCPDCSASSLFVRFDSEFRERTGVKVVKKHDSTKVVRKAKKELVKKEAVKTAPKPAPKKAAAKAK